MLSKVHKLQQVVQSSSDRHFTECKVSYKSLVPVIPFLSISIEIFIHCGDQNQSYKPTIIEKWGIISTAQKCCNKPCNIFQAVLSVKERVVDLKMKRKCGKVISFDLSQAFDRVDRGFLFNNMTSMGFNPGLVGLLRRLGDQSSSRILINGFLSPYRVK